MKNIAVIFAGGVGSRMENTSKPKQFLEIDNKPIIIHTIEKFEKCKMIDAISVACNEKYIDVLNKLLMKYNIKKVKWVVKGGKSGQLSIFNALDAIKKTEEVDDNVVALVHDGVRPAIDEKLILENIVTTRSRGNSITVAKAIETMFVSYDHKKINDLLSRDNIYLARAPQTFYLNELHKLHLVEMEMGVENNIDSCSIFHKHGYELNFITGKNSNIKITTYEDYYIYKALYELEIMRKKDRMLK